MGIHGDPLLPLTSVVEKETLWDTVGSKKDKKGTQAIVDDPEIILFDIR